MTLEGHSATKGQKAKEDGATHERRRCYSSVTQALGRPLGFALALNAVTGAASPTRGKACPIEAGWRIG